MRRVFQGGSIAAYEHVAMIKTHYRIADTLDYCLDALQNGKWGKRQADRPILKLDIHKPLEIVQLSSDGDKESDNEETVSTHASLHDGDDDITSCPSKWEAISNKS